ncbi:plant expansin [Lactarius sanguifluus]|nr:plant expansin [Lactarius sanguifluus]
MVRVLSITSLALAAVSAVSGLVVPRLSPPNGWETDILEPYGRYHERYLALQCQDKHGQPFFDQCCHPLLATQKLESRPPQCIPDDCDDQSDNTPSLSPTNATPTPTYVSPKPTHTPEPSSSTSSTPKPTSTPKPSPSTSTPKPKASPTPASHNLESSDVNAGGQATFFYQNGVAGACGKVHSDGDFICAMDERRYGNPGAKSALCGQQVRITNTKNGKTVTVTVADDCPTCLNRNSIDLSEGAFKAIASLDDGIAPIEWSFV